MDEGTPGTREHIYTAIEEQPSSAGTYIQGDYEFEPNYHSRRELTSKTMIIWAFLYLSFSSSFALPTPSDIPIDFSPSLFTRGADQFGTRSIWGIIWSCFSTLFACSWIAVHPNIPASKDSQWAILRRRLAIMGYVLIAPEMVIAWAARQHFGAKYFAKRHQERGWTMTHAFFVSMGGFTLHDEQGTPLRILEPTELENLSKAGKIKWPSITEAEIQDRSKGDHFSKGIVLIQTSWFIAQCIARGAYKLEVTELEVTTLAFAALIGIVYFLWWSKPLDVRCSIPVYLLKDDEKEKVDSQNTSSVSLVPRPMDVSPTNPCDMNSNHVDSQALISEDTRIPQQPFIVMSDLEPYYQDLRQSSHDDPPTAPEFQSTRMQQLFSFIQRQRRKHGSARGLAFVFFLYPLHSFLTAFVHMLGSNSLDNSMPLRVPTFYAPTFTYYDPLDWESTCVALCVAIVFGGIHCVAWSFHFPTLHEKLAWKISAASVTSLPILICVFATLTANRVGWSMMMTSIMSYIIARIVLLVLPCIALRALNTAALAEIQWAAFFPHIG